MDEKNILISDYDGTYKLSIDTIEQVLRNNCAIKRFMSKKNCFVISTGRDFKSMLSEFTTFNLKANYISCANGNILFDGKFNIINFNKITEQQTVFLKDNYYLFEELTGYNCYGEHTNNNIVEYVIRYKDFDSKKKLSNLFVENRFFSYYHSPEEPLVVHLFSNLSDKVIATQIISKMENISKRNIYSIGDGYNDISIVSNYNGFAVPNANSELKKVALGVYDNVSNLSTDIIENKAKKR